MKRYRQTYSRYTVHRKIEMVFQNYVVSWSDRKCIIIYYNKQRGLRFSKYCVFSVMRAYLNITLIKYIFFNTIEKVFELEVTFKFYCYSILYSKIILENIKKMFSRYLYEYTVKVFFTTHIQHILYITSYETVVTKAYIFK